jgi:hypothetical protein
MGGSGSWKGMERVLWREEVLVTTKMFSVHERLTWESRALSRRTQIEKIALSLAALLWLTDLKL